MSDAYPGLPPDPASDFSWLEHLPLDPHADDFRFGDGLLLTQLATLAYEDDFSARVLLHGIDAFEVAFAECHCGGEVMMARTAEAAFLVFVGTNELRDMRANLGFRMTLVRTWENVDVLLHAGFYSTLQTLWAPTIEPWLAALPRELPVYVGGHSQGAALAQQATVVYGDRFSQCYVVAPPRAGDKRFARALDRFGAHAIAAVNDVVTWLPLVGRRVNSGDNVRWLSWLGRFAPDRNWWRFSLYRHQRLHLLQRSPCPRLTRDIYEGAAVLVHAWHVLVNVLSGNYSYAVTLLKEHSSRQVYCGLMLQIVKTRIARSIARLERRRMRHGQGPNGQ